MFGGVYKNLYKTEWKHLPDGGWKESGTIGGLCSLNSTFKEDDQRQYANAIFILIHTGDYSQILKLHVHKLAVRLMGNPEQQIMFNWHNFIYIFS